MNTEHRKSNGIYLIHFTGGGCVYIGSTSKGFAKRRAQHVNRLRTGKHVNRHLQHAYNHYGMSQFEFIVLEVVEDASQVVGREQYWMDTYRATHQLYNILPEAGTTRGRPGRPRTDAEKENLRMKLSGRKATEERKQKQRAGFTPEVRARMGDVHRGQPITEATREKMRARMTGNKINLGRVKRSYEGFESSDGTIYRNISNLSAFCAEHGLSTKRMVSVATGKALSYKGWTLIGANREILRPRGTANFISPDGTEYRDIPSIRAFCREHGLVSGSMSALQRGGIKSCKGWTRG